MVAAQIALEKLRQHDQLLKAENEMLKVEKSFVLCIYLSHYVVNMGLDLLVFDLSRLRM